ncbi:hypothetical protein BN2475_120154 [Paraburkholderia ribeironis]|uniref:Uncharacterized protein n=1 Tax=Paraburkholderia ribeironis TaxID=1247936 RepID=A0A1N7RRB5_9BURK|nr:hypothetical protein BN2475_120154 [Paraburkholderia ribeironis]
MKASFSLEAVSDATCQHGVPPAWDMIARRGLGRRGQVLNWIGAKRYEALRCKAPLKQSGQSSEAQAALYRVLLHCATVGKFPGGKVCAGRQVVAVDLTIATAEWVYEAGRALGLEWVFSCL